MGLIIAKSFLVMGYYTSLKGDDRPVAAVYRGPIACEGCAESVAHLLRRSPARFKVHYLGPEETHDISPQTLSHLDLFAWPGGGDDVDTEFPSISYYAKPIADFVHGGGTYLGICYGAFLARGTGKRAYFDLLPQGSWVGSERFEKGSQVKGEQDTIIQTDWTFGSGKRKGQVDTNRWQYFQDGARIYLEGAVKREAKILGTYSYTGNPCATISKLGKGTVGLIGTHPEADQSWYDDWDGRNPDGIRYDIGFDFVQTLWESRGSR